MLTIPIGITARNEARNILALIESLRHAIAFSEREIPACRFEIHVLLNDNTDETPRLLNGAAGVRVWDTSGGLVEAQRRLVEETRNAPFVIFSDADILVDPAALGAVTRAMLDNPGLEVAYAEKYPLPPRRRSLLARALYLFNLREGYQTQRPYFNGQFFAIRNWRIPPASALKWDPARNNRFLHLEAGIRADDIYLSREVLGRVGAAAIRCVPEGIRYRPPETLKGMYRKYQRMILEIERLDCYFPRMAPAHRRHLDRTLLRAAPASEKFFYLVFQSALLLCKAGYAWQRFYYSRWSSTPCPTWLPVSETKERIS